MKAVTVIPGVPGSLRLLDVPRPSPGRGQVLLKPIRVGVCGTDKEIIEGRYGKAPEESQYLILGHEAVAEVAELGDGVDNVSVGEIVVPKSRIPLDCIPEDFCPTDHYLEPGVWGMHGFAAEYALMDSRYLVKVPKEIVDIAVLTEPLSNVEKAIDMAIRIGQARWYLDWKPKNALILGAGPIGLLATMVFRLMGLSTLTVDIRPPDSLKAKLVRELGGKYIDITAEQISGEFDIVFEATGSTQALNEGFKHIAPNGIYVIMGIYPSGGSLSNLGELMTNVVLNNKVIVGSVDSNIKHYEIALEHLRRAKEEFNNWPAKLITKRASLDNYQEAYTWTSDDVKNVLEINPL